MHMLHVCGAYVLAGFATLAVPASTGMARVGVRVLHVFKGGSDGAGPNGVMEDSVGNLYGATGRGGGTGCNGFGCGTVFKLAPDGTETVVYAFLGGTDGAHPHAGVIENETGDLVGTTGYGGAGYCGTAFKLAPDATLTVLHAFAGGNDGCGPNGLIEDSAGNLFGTTYNGGGAVCEMGHGCGTVFKLAPNGKETVLYTFNGRYDGYYPAAGVIRDKAGNLYGSTLLGGTGGGCQRYGCGTIFKLAPDGTETVLYDFTNGRDGCCSAAALTEDKAGTLYGTTETGGTGFGIVFKIAPDGTEMLFYAFRGPNQDGADPQAGLIQDRAGNLYGTTAAGGTGCELHLGCGTVFKLTPDGAETVLYSFKHKRHSRYPDAALMKGKNGNLFGTTGGGGGCNALGCGSVFRVKK